VGHKRNIYTPKTQRWLAIVEELASFAIGQSEVSEIAKQTLKNVNTQYSKLEDDPSVKAAFEFIIQVSVAFQKEDPVKYLRDSKILDAEELSILKLSRAATEYKKDQATSYEYRTFATQAVVDALNNWYISNIDRGISLFNDKLDSQQILYKVSSGSGFCEVSRLFFAKFTERYLKYFLEREASSVISKTTLRNKFTHDLEANIENISKHAFETAKITQSFAAGWFNKHVKGTVPKEKEIEGFLAHSFGKMRRELLEEELN
jgi:hypothetical protein